MNRLNVIQMLIILIPAEAFANDLSQTSADSLAMRFLNECNQREGLEYFGNARELSEYTCTKGYDEMEECMYFHYQLSREVSPKYFNIYVKSFNNFKLTSLGTISPEMLIESSPLQQARLLKSLPLVNLLKWIFCYYDDEEAEIYSIVIDKGNIDKEHLPLINIHSIMRNENDTIDIFLGPSFGTRYDEYQPYGLTLSKNNGAWEILSGGVRNTGKEARPFKEPFICFDDPNENDLLTICKMLGKIENIGRISGIDFFENTAFVYFGQDGQAFPFGNPYLGQPKIHFRCQYQEGLWYLRMQSVIHCEPYDKRCELFIPDIPTDNLSHPIEWYPFSDTDEQVQHQFAKQDWPEILKVMHRLQWFEKREYLLVDVPDPNKVTIFSRMCDITFIKESDQWLFLGSNDFFNSD